MIAGAGSVSAAPTLDIRGVAARVTIIPENRRDIAISLVRADPRLPIRVRKLLDRVFVTGDVSRAVHSCRAGPGGKGVAVRGRGIIANDQLPVIVVRTPWAVRLLADEAVFGEIQRSGSVDFTNKGCGDWHIDDVAGRLRFTQAGAGDARVGSAGTADLSVEGTGGISAREVRAGLTAVSSGSGDIAVAAVRGPVDARVAGAGDIFLASGMVTTMTVAIAGSGAVTLNGSARTLNASIAGRGDVSVAHVTGRVVKQVFGAGMVRTGR
jgi:hypothetical protein